VIIAATWLVEAFVLDKVASLYALMVAALALVVALIIAAYPDRRRGRGSAETPSGFAGPGSMTPSRRPPRGWGRQYRPDGFPARPHWAETSTGVLTAIA
jgi:hypothetical protein